MDVDKIRIWNAEEGKIIKTFSGHSIGATRLSFSPDNQVLVSELQKHLRDKVARLTDNFQKLTIRLENVINDFMVWRN